MVKIEIISFIFLNLSTLMALVDNFFPNNYTKFNTLDFARHYEAELTEPEPISNLDHIYSFKKELPNKVQVSDLTNGIPNFDYLELPSPIINILYSQFKINYTGFVPDRFFRKYGFSVCDLEYAKIRLSLIFSQIKFVEQKKYLYEYFMKELCIFSGLHNPVKLGTNVSNFDSIKIQDKDVQVILSESNNKNNFDMLLITPYVIGLVLSNCTIIFNPGNPNDHFMIASETFNYFSSDISTASFNFIVNNDKVKLVGSMNRPNNEKQSISLEYGGDLMLNYSHVYAPQRLNYKKFYCLKKNRDEYQIINKNDLLIIDTYNYATNVEKLISVCMVDDSKTGLRFRGKYEEEKSNGKTVHKKLSQDENTVYEKNNDKVLVDKISNIKIKDEIIIGWKVAKSPNGEKRIIKLAIPADAQIIKAIDDEYFSTRGKERCDKAIVMDIQLPDEQDEISVVPHEKQAFSYIFTGSELNSKPFEYNLGQEIVPDLFDTNEDKSCTHGIHFYRDRQLVFDVYINK